MIYLDSAATTLQKPRQVQRAVAYAVHHMSSPGRGSYPASHLAEQTAYQCRMEAAQLFDVSSPEQVVFTHNATHGLNIAIRSLVSPGARVIISGYEHNAVTRPLNDIEDVELTVLDTPLFDQGAMVEELREALQTPANAVIVNHVSNVFGGIQPVDEMAELCRQANVPLIVDASQSAGVLPVQLNRWQAAFVAMPGHKGLYGPQGTGLLLCGHEAKPLILGGTGSASRLLTMPPDLPDFLEAGTHNMVGISGLLEGIRFVRRTKIECIDAHERRLMRQAAKQLSRLPGVTVFTASESEQTGVLSFAVANRDCEEIGEALAQRGIAVRAGLHCAPLAHRTVGTIETGTVRLSMSYFTTIEEINAFAHQLAAIVRGKVTS